MGAQPAGLLAYRLQFCRVVTKLACYFPGGRVQDRDGL